MPNVMELMREYKHLKQLKSTQGKLTDLEEARLREVSAYLQGSLQGKKSDEAGSQAKPPTKPQAAATPATKPAPSKPVAAAAPSKPAEPAAAALKPIWQQQAEEDRARQARAAQHFKVVVPDEVMTYEPPAASDDEGIKAFDADGDLEDEPGQTDKPRPAARPDSRVPPKKKRAQTPEEVEKELADVSSRSAYTSDFDELLGDYYYSYVNEGYQVVAEQVALEVLDPREIELRRAGLLSTSGAPGSGVATITRVPGGTFLDDFMMLYEKGILPRPSDDEDAEADDPNAMVQARRKVTVHMLNGEVRRGVVDKILQGAAGFMFKPQGAPAEEVPFVHIKALFVQAGSRAAAEAVKGRPLTVEFRDRRAVQGISPDYRPGVPVFTLIPQGKGNFERVIVNAGAVARIG